MNILIIFVTLMVSVDSYGRTTYQQILSNKPKIDKKYAMKLAVEINKAADKYKVPANILAAICRQESSYDLTAVNTSSNDYGLFQINEHNIIHYEIDKKLLLKDLGYSVDMGAKVFEWFYKKYPTLEESVKRFNVGTAARADKWESAIDYWSKVRRFM